MKRLLISLLAIGQYEGAYADGPDRTTIVKISSQECKLPTTRFEGSGILFRRNGKSYVLTSDHTVLHTNKNMCHAIWNAKIGSQGAKYLYSNWAEGFSLLEVPKLIPQASWMDLTDGSPVTFPYNESVTVFGYSHSSNTLIETSSNKVADLSEELFYSAGEHMLKITDIHGEFGMSGGPIFKNGYGGTPGSEFLGIVTHQKIESTGATTLYGLTRTSFDRITDQYFRFRGYIEPFLWQDVKAQSLSLLTVYSDEFVFQIDCSKKPCSVKVSTQPKDSWGQPLSPDRGLSLEIAERIEKGEDFPHPFYDRITWTVVEAMKGLPKSKRATIRKFRWSEKYVKQDPKLKNKLRYFNDANEFFHTLIEGFAGDVWQPVYE